MDDAICNHPDFDAHFSIARLLDIDAYQMDITVKCAACGMPFKFLGVPGGWSSKKPMTSITGMELSAPIAPVTATLPVPENLLKCFEESRKPRESK